MLLLPHRLVQERSGQKPLEPPLILPLHCHMPQHSGQQKHLLLEMLQQHRHPRRSEQQLLGLVELHKLLMHDSLRQLLELLLHSGQQPLELPKMRQHSRQKRLELPMLLHHHCQQKLLA
jgi:hypothetical protein